MKPGQVDVPAHRLRLVEKFKGDCAKKAREKLKATARLSLSQSWRGHPAHAFAALRRTHRRSLRSNAWAGCPCHVDGLKPVLMARRFRGECMRDEG
jgi:hypothetical protein